MMVGIGHDLNGVPMNQSHYHLGIVGKVIRDQNGNVVDFTVIHASGYYSANGTPRGRGVIEEKASVIAAEGRNDPHHNRFLTSQLLQPPARESPPVVWFYPLSHMRGNYVFGDRCLDGDIFDVTHFVICYITGLYVLNLMTTTSPSPLQPLQGLRT